MNVHARKGKVPTRISLTATLIFAGLTLGAPAFAQQAAADSSLPKPVHFTANQAHAYLKKELGIETLRPGPSGDPHAPNHANYDEAKADPYPNVPNALVLKDGQKVTTAKEWWTERRPQIVHAYSKYVYGFVPKNVPKVTWSVVASEREFVGFSPVIATELKGHVDNSSYPLIKVNLRMTLVTPANAKGPVPVLMMFGPSGFPNPV